LQDLGEMLFLSYTLSCDTPAYGGQEGSLVTRAVSSILDGDSCNTSNWSLMNYFGTHIDSPHHFFQEGATITDYPADFWTFNTVQVLTIPMNSG
jgi:arylformamidase